MKRWCVSQKPSKNRRLIESTAAKYMITIITIVITPKQYKSEREMGRGGEPVDPGIDFKVKSSTVGTALNGNPNPCRASRGVVLITWKL